MSSTKYFIVEAPGTYGDRGHIWSSHRTLAAAKKNCGTGSVVRAGSLKRGDKWLRVYEQTYPIVK